MATSNHTTTFWHFLENYSIEIPIIQRDYAQGRIGKETLRKNFLTDLKEALDKALDKSKPHEKMKLDFIYGSTENGKLYPLDGQQRLTTLWLMHWHIALRAGKLNEASERLKRFSYETRVSSRNFCGEMCNPKNFKNYNCSNGIVEFITNQTWFYSAWKQDPTIQSMLRMLGGNKDKKKDTKDGIEKVFDCCNCISNKENRFERYYTLLIGEDCPIVFYYLPKDFGNSDDLYIKMNARGEQLTSFENFKADLIGYITKQSEDEKDEVIRTEWKNLLDPECGIPIKLDTDWTNIFWKHKSVDYRIDDIYFAFLNRFFLNYCFLEIKDENDKRYTYFTGNGSNNNDNAIAYETIDDYEVNNEIDLDFFTQLKNTLNNYYDSKIDETTDILRYNYKWNPKFFFIPRYDDEEKQELIKNAKGDFVKKIFTLTQKERVVYYAICKFFIQGPVEQNDNKELDYTSLKRWMRFVWNLVSVQTADGGDSIRSVAEMKKAINLINEIQDTHVVYESLNKFDESKYSGTILKDQFAEEIAKAKQILDEYGSLRKYNGFCKKADGSNYQTWEKIIIEAENYAFFKGAIRFLFTDENGDMNDKSWGNFDIKWEYAQKFFEKDGNGVTTQYETENALLRTLISYFEKKEHFQEPYYDNTHWRSILLDKKLSSPVCSLLTKECISDFKKYTPNCNDPQLALVQKQLVETDLIDNLPKEGYYMEDDLKLHVYYGHRETTDIYLGDSVHENHILADLVKQDSVSCDQRLKEMFFFFGRNINFKYNKYFFRWYGFPNEKKLDVYLMEDNWTGCKKRQNPTNEKGTDEDVYFCFRVDENTTSDIFTKMLDCLIHQAEANKQNKPCYVDCKNKVCE